MTYPIAERYADLIASTPLDRLWPDSGEPADGLLMERGVAASQLVSVHYAPFDYVNRDARVIILGITPGRQQARMATERFGARLRAGDTLKDALRSAKGYASFGGDMRSRLVRMLDRFRVNAYLGIASCASLWSGDEHLAQFCSGLRYPVLFENDYANYTGTPRPWRTPFLRKWMSFLPDMIDTVPGALVVPLGTAMHDPCHALVQQGMLVPERLLIGIEHPSGASNGASGYLMDPRPRHTYPERSSIGFERIDRNRAAMERQMADLIAGRVGYII